MPRTSSGSARGPWAGRSCCGSTGCRSPRAAWPGRLRSSSAATCGRPPSSPTSTRMRPRRRPTCWPRAEILEPGRPLTFVAPDRAYRHLRGARERRPRAWASGGGAPAGAGPGRQRTRRRASAAQRAGGGRVGRGATGRRPHAPPRAAARPSPPPCTCDACSRSRRRRRASRASCWSWAWPRPAPGCPDWPAHLEAALDGATDDSGRVAAAMVLALALGRAHESAAAVDVLDRAASLLDSAEPGLAARLEAATVGVGIIDVATAPAMARRREAVLERAADDRPAPPELLAVAAFASVLTNRAGRRRVRSSRERALAAGRDALSGATDRPWYAHATWFSQTTVSLLWAERYERVVPLLDSSIAQARATGDSGRFAVGLAHRAWVALRRGELDRGRGRRSHRAGGGRAPRAGVLPRPQRRRPDRRAGRAGCARRPPRRRSRRWTPRQKRAR